MRHKALMVAYGVHESRRREVIGIEVGEAETEAFWREFLRSLRSRGLSGVRLCVSNGTALPGVEGWYPAMGGRGRREWVLRQKRRR